MTNSDGIGGEMSTSRGAQRVVARSAATFDSLAGFLPLDQTMPHCNQVNILYVFTHDEICKGIIRGNGNNFFVSQQIQIKWLVE